MEVGFGEKTPQFCWDYRSFSPNRPLDQPYLPAVDPAWILHRKSLKGLGHLADTHQMSVSGYMVGPAGESKSPASQEETGR